MATLKNNGTELQRKTYSHTWEPRFGGRTINITLSQRSNGKILYKIEKLWKVLYRRTDRRTIDALTLDNVLERIEDLS